MCYPRLLTLLGCVECRHSFKPPAHSPSLIRFPAFLLDKCEVSSLAVLLPLASPFSIPANSLKSLSGHANPMFKIFSGPHDYSLRC